MNYLEELENKSVYVIREAFLRFKNPALLWSIGKDSTALLWLCRKAFFGEVPFPVMHIDTTYEFPQVYALRDRYAKECGFNLLVEKNQEAIDKGVSYATHDAFTCCHELKTIALQKAIKKHNFDALFVGIRRDEHNIRAKERYFSSRSSSFEWNYKNQNAEMWDHYQKETEEDQHMRVHPLLEWTEIDIWNYIKSENIPVSELYFAKDGKRFRSLGCMPTTHSVDSEASTIDKIINELKVTRVSERSGRSQDKESNYIMQKLRALGYM